MTRQKVQRCCLIMWKSRFSHNAPKTLIFHVLLRGKASFLMTRQKGANLLHYYVSKQVFSWRAKNSYILCIFTWKNRFSHDARKRCRFFAVLRGKTGFLMTWPKTKCIFDALLRGKAGFLVTRQKLLHLMPYYVEKQVFSWRTKNSYIWCIITWKSSFSHDAAKSANVLPYYVEKQVFSLRAKNSYISCIITWKSKFSHDTPKRCKFVALLRFEVGFLVTRQKLLHFMHCYV